MVEEEGAFVSVATLDTAEVRVEEEPGATCKTELEAAIELPFFMLEVEVKKPFEFVAAWE